MNKENTRALYRAFPELYRGHTKSLMESSMAFGFECGDGWFQIILNLSKVLTDVAHSSGVAVPECLSVKEKLGSLRFYLGEVDDSIADTVKAMVSEAESKASKTCDVCGKAGIWRGDPPWLKTRCEEHA